LRTIRGVKQLDAFDPPGFRDEPAPLGKSCAAICEASRALVAQSRELLDRLEAEQCQERQAVLKFGWEPRDGEAGARIDDLPT